MPAAKYVRIHCQEQSRIRTQFSLGLQYSRNTSLTPGNYFVFIDTNTAFSSDARLRARRPLVSKEIYYAEVNSLLTYLADKTGIRPLIQLHPKANREIVSRLYEHPISDIDTISAIAHSSFVVTHHSTAFFIALYMRKPLLFVRPSEMSLHVAKRSDSWVDQICKTVDYIADSLGEEVFSSEDIMSSPITKHDMLRYDEKKYLEFEQNHTNTSMLTLSTQEIVRDSLLDLFG